MTKSGAPADYWWLMFKELLLSLHARPKHHLITAQYNEVICVVSTFVVLEHQKSIGL